MELELIFSEAIQSCICNYMPNLSSHDIVNLSVCFSLTHCLIAFLQLWCILTTETGLDTPLPFSATSDIVVEQCGQ